MQCFVVSSDEIEERLDPFYYNPFFDEIKNLQSFVKWDIQEVSGIAELVIDGIHKKPEYSSIGMPFIQVNNLKEGIIDFQHNIKYVSDEWESVVLKRYSPLAGDILITKDGTIGVAATVPDEFSPFSIFVSVAAIRPNKEKIVPKFLEIIINSPIIQKQIYRATRGAVLSHLLLEVIRKLRIPLPPFQVQNQIVDIMQSAYSQKEQKEAEAQRLLDLINDFILDELEIRLPKAKQQMCNVINSDEITNRLDPYYYKNEFRLDFGKHVVKRLEDIFASITDGDHGNPEYFEEGIPYLRVVDVEKGVINKKNMLRISNDYSKRLYKSCFAKEDDWLISIVGTIGKTLIVDKQYLPLAISRGFAILTPQKQSNINCEYVHSFSKSQLFRSQMERNRVGSVQSGVYLNSVKNIQIPLPPLEIQNRIAEEVKRRISEAARLKAEASRIIEETKQRVEGMILGN